MCVKLSFTNATQLMKYIFMASNWTHLELLLEEIFPVLFCHLSKSTVLRHISNYILQKQLKSYIFSVSYINVLAFLILIPGGDITKWSKKLSFLKVHDILPQVNVSNYCQKPRELFSFKLYYKLSLICTILTKYIIITLLLRIQISDRIHSGW